MNTLKVVPNRFPLRLKGLTACLTLWIGFALHPVSATTLVSDSFADGDRTTQNLPSSVAWYQLGSSTTTVSSSTGYSITPANSGSASITIGYFGSTSLAIGSSMTLSFSVTESIVPTAASAHQGLRFGLYNSGSTATTSTLITGDSTTLTNASFSSYIGYAGFYSLQSALDPTGLAITQRDGGTSGLTNSLFAGATYTTLGSAGSSLATAGTTYTVTLTLQYVSATEMDITSTVNGNSLTKISSTPVTTFDTIGIFSSGLNGTVTLDNITVSTVPEPNVLALLTLASVGMIIVRYNRKEKKAILT